MKNKRLIIILCIFSFLVLIAVLCSTVFTVKKVSLNWLTTKGVFAETENLIVEDVKKGESVFLVDKKSIISTLENKYPYLKVVSAEIKFPNKLVLHTAVREELYSLKIKDGTHAILDSECKVLNIVKESELNKELKPIPLELKGYVYNDVNFEVSKEANIGWIKNVIKNLSLALYQCGYMEIDSKNNISSVKIDVSGYENKIILGMNYKDVSGKGGVNIEIQQISDMLSEKFKMAIGIYDDLSASEKSAGVIRIYTSNGKIEGEYSPEG